MFSSNDSQQFKCHAKPPEASDLQLPPNTKRANRANLPGVDPPDMSGASATCIIEATLSTACTRQAGWGFPPLQGCLYNAVVTLQLPTQSWLYDPTNANLCYLSFQYHDFIPYANLCQSLNLICTSTYQGLDSGRPDSYPAVQKKHGLFDTLTFLLHSVFKKKKSPKLWFWIIFFFCEKNKSWEFGIISRGFLTKTIPGPWLNIIDWGVPLSRLIKSTRSSTQISCLHQRTQNGGCNFFFKQKGFRKQFQKKWANHPSNQNNNDSLTHFPKVLRIKPYIKKSCPWSMTNNGIHAKATCFPNVEPKISFYTGSTCPRLRGNGPWQKSLQKLVSCVLLSVMKVLRLWLLERWWWCLCTLRRAFRGIWHLSWHCLKASNQSISD